MAEAGTYSSTLDPGIDYVFTSTFSDSGGGLIDLSGLTFIFILKRNIDGTISWNVTNNQFSRPNSNTISFTKFSSEVRAMMQGNYTLSLLVSGTAFIDAGNRTFSNDEWITGTLQR